MRKLSIAILGTRGVPARYGGFETFAAELGTRLVQDGHDVTVYCRSSLYGDVGREWNGIRRVELPSIRHKYLDTISHAFLPALHAVTQRYDVVLLCNAVNSVVIPILKLRRLKVAINVDGIERRRKKWNILGRFMYQLGESCSVRFADAIVADAEVIASYYARRHGERSEVIAYGSDFPSEGDTDVLARFGLNSRGYILYVSRMEPENNPLKVVRSYRRSGVRTPLLMIGSAPYSAELLRQLQRETGNGVMWPGGVYDADYRTLQRNALLYVQATEVGGTHPALIEAMGSGGAVAALGTPENREVGSDSVIYFDFGGGTDDLAEILKKTLDVPAKLDVYRNKARQRAAEHYSWTGVTRQYEQLFERLCEGVAQRE
jgi:glycosyltransferase involved in cell wall biosynthesis